MNSRQRFETELANRAKSKVVLDSRDKAIIGAIATAVNLPANKLQAIYDDAQLKLNVKVKQWLPTQQDRPIKMPPT